MPQETINLSRFMGQEMLSGDKREEVRQRRGRAGRGGAGRGGAGQGGAGRGRPLPQEPLGADVGFRR